MIDVSPHTVWPPTPGPWHVVPEEDASHRWVVANDSDVTVASCEPAGPWVTEREADANARLIAAAKDMAAALRMTIADLEMNSMHGLSRLTIERIRAALAKGELVG